MGPNLTRLFECLPQRPLAIVRDPNGDVLDIVDAHGESLPGRADEAKVIVMLANHGEALIEALERLLEENEDYIKINNLSAMGNVNLVNARALLALLEDEAKL